jgi:hypothetical protein
LLKDLFALGCDGRDALTLGSSRGGPEIPPALEGPYRSIKGRAVEA